MLSKTIRWATISLKVAKVIQGRSIMFKIRTFLSQTHHIINRGAWPQTEIKDNQPLKIAWIQTSTIWWTPQDQIYKEEESIQTFPFKLKTIQSKRGRQTVATQTLVMKIQEHILRSTQHHIRMQMIITLSQSLLWFVKVKRWVTLPLVMHRISVSSKECQHHSNNQQLLASTSKLFWH